MSVIGNEIQICFKNKINCYFDLLSFEIRVLYMSFDRFLLAVESRDLSQAGKILIRGSSLVKLSCLVNTFFRKKLLFTQAQTFCKINPLNPLRFTSHQKLRQMFTFSVFQFPTITDLNPGFGRRCYGYVFSNVTFIMLQKVPFWQFFPFWQNGTFETVHKIQFFL